MLKKSMLSSIQGNFNEPEVRKIQFEMENFQCVTNRLWLFTHFTAARAH